MSTVKFGADGMMICLKDKLICDKISTKSLAETLNNCVPYAAVLGLNDEEVITACNMAIDAFMLKGIKSLEGDDQTRNDICRLLFGIPLKNLRRKEERMLDINPSMSAADEVIAPKVKGAPAESAGVRASNPVPSYIFEEYSAPDEKAFEGYIGNSENVAIALSQINGSELRGDALRPVLIRGASGCGKTEFARRISKRRGWPFARLTASAIKSGEDMVGLLNSIPNHSTVFIDEVHDMPSKAFAVLYEVENNGGFKDANGRNKEFFFIFATNLSGKLPEALKNRCIEFKLKDYTVGELAEIAKLTAKNSGAYLESGVGGYIAARSHGIARYAVEYCKDIILETAADRQTVTLSNAAEFFKRHGIDGLGLKEEHRQYMRKLAMLGQASSHSMAAALGENDVAEVSRSIEPLLLKHGLIGISSRGRYLTERGKSYVQSLNATEEYNG